MGILFSCEVAAAEQEEERKRRIALAHEWRRWVKSPKELERRIGFANIDRVDQLSWSARQHGPSQSFPAEPILHHFSGEKLGEWWLQWHTDSGNPIWQQKAFPVIPIKGWDIWDGGLLGPSMWGIPFVGEWQNIPPQLRDEIGRVFIFKKEPKQTTLFAVAQLNQRMIRSHDDDTDLRWFALPMQIVQLVEDGELFAPRVFSGRPTSGDPLPEW